MENDDHQSSPARRSSPLPGTPRNFTTQELEAVIRRAVELQSGNSVRTEEGVSDAEVVRIGQELGLEPMTVRRAMAEVRLQPAAESGALVTVAGPRTVRAARVVRRPAAATALLLENYLRETEFMVAQRRFSDRTRYIRDSSLAAGLARFTRGLSRAHQPINVSVLDVTVSAIDNDSCMLELTVDLSGMRGGLVGGMLGSSGGLAAVWAAAVWATPIIDSLMFAGVPVVAGAWFGMRAIYASIRRSTQEKLESLIDRLEHGELS